jgi:hypothetical protein
VRLLAFACEEFALWLNQRLFAVNLNGPDRADLDLLE